MRSGRIVLILLASLVVARPGPAWGPPPQPEPAREFVAPPPPPPGKPRELVVSQEGRDEGQLRCLAMTIYWEAGREPPEGQRAVAHVVLNRVGQPGFADTICGVVHQGGRHFPCQFHWYCSGADTTPRDEAWWSQAQTVARQALDERDPTGGALYFHLVSVHPAWAMSRFSRRRVIGHHVFFGRRA